MLQAMQQNLFLNDSQARLAEMEKIPIARQADPQSSKDAGERVTQSGRRGEQHKQVLSAVKAHPGSTSLELAHSENLDRHMVARRLPELEKLLLVRRGEARLCRQGTGKAVTWWPK